jgi:hypothetical protein
MSDIPAISTDTTVQTGTCLITLPPLPGKMTFTPGQLAGCMARAAATSAASPGVVAGFSLAFSEMLNTLIDTGYSDLTFLTDIEDLADSMRTAFSGSFGAGMADLYMSQLGYVFRCNGRELLGRGVVFDLAYDATSSAGNHIVAVEAKGSIQSGADLVAVRASAKRGYSAQVLPHLGAVVKHATVVHGYAIGSGSQLKRGVCCDMHVQETKWSSGAQGGSPGVPPATQRPNANVAIRNYRDVFRLLNSGGILDAIDGALSGDWQRATAVRSQHLPVVMWRGDNYVGAQSMATTHGHVLVQFFGLQVDAANSFLSGLSACIRDQRIAERFPAEIPVRPLDTAKEFSLQDGGAEFPDGLAYFGHEPPKFRTSFLKWDPLEGPIREWV